MFNKSSYQLDSSSVESVDDSIYSNTVERMNRYKFILKARALYGSSYDYSGIPDETLYQSSTVQIKCPKHGLFTQTVQSHLGLWSGCISCDSYSDNFDRLR